MNCKHSATIQEYCSDWVCYPPNTIFFSYSYCIIMSNLVVSHREKIKCGNKWNEKGKKKWTKLRIKRREIKCKVATAAFGSGISLLLRLLTNLSSSFFAQNYCTGFQWCGTVDLAEYTPQPLLSHTLARQLSELTKSLLIIHLLYPCSFVDS